MNIDEYLSSNLSTELPTFIVVSVFTDIGATKGNCYRIGTPKTWDDLKVIIKNNILGATCYDGTPAMLSLVFHFDADVETIDFEQTETGFTKKLSVFMNDINSKLITDFVNSAIA